MLNIIGVGVAAIVVAVLALLGFASRKPDTFNVERVALIKAPPEKIFSLLNDYRNWLVWSPYETKDPAMKRTFSGAVAGKGAVYDFEGNSQVGSGRLEITDTAPPAQLQITLDMIRPMAGHNIINFTLVSEGEATRVTWAMHGATPLAAKVVGVIFDMDKMIGGDFDTGLAKLTAWAEKPDP